MGHGMNYYDHKKKRAMRRRNHIARDLADKKYRQRRVEDKRRKPDYLPDFDVED